MPTPEISEKSDASESRSNAVPKTPPEHYFDDNFVAQVRARLLEVIATGEFAYDPIDVAQLESADDWFIRRFLAWKPTILEEAVETMKNVLKWRKETNINAWKDSDFPSEFYQVAACFRYLPDRENHNILILRLRYNKRDPTGLACIEQLARNYFIHVVEKIVSQNPNQGFGIIFDCFKATISNVDLSMARFIINTLSSYYSGAISYVCIYELPWLFNKIWSIVQGWLDEDAKKIVRFATRKNIHEMIEPNNLPDYMDGKGTKDYRLVPKGVPSLDEVAEALGVTSQRDRTKLNDHFHNLIRLDQK